MARSSDHAANLATHKRECLAELERLGIFAGLHHLDAVTLDTLLAQVLAAIETGRQEATRHD